MAKEVWADEDDGADAKARHQNEMAFPIGAPNDAFAKYFIGQSYLAPLSTEQVGIYNVTFEPGCRNNWTHITPKAVAGRSSSAWLVEGFIRNGANRHKSCALAM